MTIERIHSTDRMSRIVTHNGTVYLCGQTAGQAEWDIAEQTRQCLGKIEALLSEANSSKEMILSVTIYIRDMKDFAAMNAIWDEWVSDLPKPARACVEARMARPEILVEMSVIAAQV
ncbi:Translation initiation inhibitor [Marinobacterium lacunae]|uniref:Translation initiation inhibitor n=1 Tax=Marinobacterium lacunae TaxID=1232683 RepID=A0A081FYZ4_9GAMM|nr:RidA family protein [Marinobacterium lacunae]KEA63749.1 Translation initiation inhibitor [Marinobacterium lacunae]MBR9885918.1 RidA family protein [Oceanospirillales bacterium]